MLTLGLALVACSPALEPTARVSFVIENLPESGVMTRVPADSILSVLTPSTSAKITVTSKTKSARVYSSTVGQSLTLAYDSYSVEGSWTPTLLGEVLFGRLYEKPPYTVTGEFTVSDPDGVYPLEAVWDCAALIIKPSEVLSVTASSAFSGYDSILPRFKAVGDYGVVFVSGAGWTTAKPLVVTVTPKDDVNYEPVTYNFTTGTLRKGRWYYLSPEAVEVTSGSFNIDFPGWEAGAE